MRKRDEGWVKKFMKFRVEGRRPVGRPRRTWLESMEADMTESVEAEMTELEINTTGRNGERML